MIKAIEISLIIVAIHASMWEGMIFGRLRIALSDALDSVGLSVLKMPLFDCLICMGGIWTLILYPILFGLSIEIIPTFLIVIGLNTLIDKYLQHD